MTDTGDALAPGTRLDEFEIERVLGAGGFGVTYLARDVSLAVWRGVKEYLPRDWGTRRGDGTIGPRTEADSADYRWGLDRFLDEARILAQFDHRNIVRVYRVFEARGTAYMVTEYVEGQTLAAEVEATGPLSEARVREVLDALTDGLLVVHASGLLHRDIKPGNVMVRPDGTPVLIDFGAARQLMGGHSRSVTAVLTPGYAPIEQYSSRGHQGPWTDIYALGAVVYWALSGGVPEDATERVRQDRLRPLAEVAPGRVSARFAAAVDAALAVNENARPQNLAAWRAELAQPSTGTEPVSSLFHPNAGVFGSEATAGDAGGDVVGLSPTPTVAEAWARRWWRSGAAVAGLAGVALVVALTAPWNGTDSDGEGVSIEGVETVQVPLSAGTETSVDEGAAGTGEPRPSANPAATNPAPDPNPETREEEATVAERGRAAEATALSPAAVEEALALDRAARRVVQAGLVAAGFDSGVADGLFGSGTRAAIREWQVVSGMAATGYLDATSSAALRALAEDAMQAEARRQAELEAEAQRQAELEARRQAELELEARRQAELELEARRQAELEAEARRQAELEAEARRQAELAAEKRRQAALGPAVFLFGFDRDAALELARRCPRLRIVPSLNRAHFIIVDEGGWEVRDSHGIWHLTRVGGQGGRINYVCEELPQASGGLVTVEEAIDSAERSPASGVPAVFLGIDSGWGRLARLEWGFKREEVQRFVRECRQMQVTESLGLADFLIINHSENRGYIWDRQGNRVAVFNPFRRRNLFDDICEYF